jgi:hypothetical protein
MRWAAGLLFLCGLSGCTNFDARLDPQGILFAQQVSRLTAHYNDSHGTHYPVPQVSTDDIGLPASAVAASQYSTWSIHINPAWVRRDSCLVIREALPHELAHLFVYYDEYGPPQTAMLPTTEGTKLIAMNGPGLQDLSSEHGPAWQEKARQLGANPCREGYCPAANPYRREPPDCGAFASATNALRGTPD